MRWKRSGSFSAVTSKGVVMVPSSVYPRTWMLAWLVRARRPVIHSEMKVQSDGRRILALEPPISHR